MPVEIKKLDNCEVEIKCEMGWPELDVYYQKVFANVVAGAKVPGFRPGKAPENLLKDRINEQGLLSEAAEMALQDKFSETISKENLEVISKPQAEILKLAQGNEFCFKIKFFVLPEIKLPDCQAIAKTIEKKTAIVQESEIDETLKWIARSRAEFSDLTRPCQKGDWLDIEYQSPQVEMNKKFEDGFLLGESKFVPGFEDALYGLMTGDEKEFQIIFPSDYKNKELAGKPVDFKAKIKAVKEMKLPELNDDFAQKIGRFKNIAELKENIKNGILQEKNMQETQKWRASILDAIAKETKLDMPEPLIAAEKEKLLENLKHEVSEHLKLGFEDYLKQVNKDLLALQAELSEQAEKRITHYLILRGIAKQEGITAADQEIAQEIDKFLASYPQDTGQEIDRPRLREYYKEMIINEKVFQWLET